MEKQAVVHNTFVIERIFEASPERVFAAFTDARRKRRWFAEGDGSALQEYSLDFRVGGSEHTRFLCAEGTPVAGATMSNVTRFLDIVPGCRIVAAYTMAMNGRIFSASLSTYEMSSAEGKTRLVFTEQGAFFEGSDGAVMREHGWRQLLESLAKEIEGKD